MRCWSLLAVLLAGSALAQDAPPASPDPSADPGPEAEALPLVEGPGIEQYIEAPYPPEAQASGLEAVVRMNIELDAEGTVVNVEILEPVGHGFDEAAVDAVLQMTFTPARTAEGPVPVIFEFEYGFVLTPEVPVEEVPLPVNFEGLVREMGTRKPLEGVTVSIEGTEISAKTDDEGRFEVRGVPWDSKQYAC